MAGKLKQTVETEFTSKGGKKVAKETESIGRAQTRLGQTAASSGRQFSAQASGLGGLVAAYAGAAANVFALQQAFAALTRAAQAETIVRGTKTLALEIGESGQVILDNIRAITEGQLSLAEVAGNVNIALSAGFDSSQIEKLTVVSLKASRALGRTLNDAFTRVTRGAAKLEPELLDELGIFTRIDPAVEAYASKLNVAASSLTNYEKRQAFVNAVIEEGEKKFSSINTAIPSTQKSIEQLTTTLTDLALEFGQLIASGLQPFLNFISGNAGNAILLFGGILTLVFGKAFQLIGGFVARSIKDLQLWAQTLGETGKKAEQSMGFLQRQAGALQATIDAKDRGGLAAGKGRFTGLGLKAPVAQEAAKVRQRFLAGDFSKKEADLKFLKQLPKTMDQTANATKDATHMIKAYEKGVGMAGVKSLWFTRISRGMGVALAFAAKWASRLMSALNFLFLAITVAQLVGTLFDRDFLKDIKEFFVDMSQAAENAVKGLTGALADAAGGTKELETQLKFLGATNEDLKELPKTIKKINDEVTKASRATALAAAPKTGQTSAVGWGGVADIPDAADANALAEADKAALSISKRRVEVEKMIVKEQKLGIKGDQQKIFLLQQSVKALENVGNSQELIGAIARSTGIATDQVAATFKKLGDVADDGSISFDLLGTTLHGTETTFKNLSQVTKEGLINMALFDKTVKDANKSFEEGSATSETLSKKLGGIQKAFNKLAVVLDELDPGEVTDAMVDGFSAALKEIEKVNAQVRVLKKLETVGKALTDTFGGAIKALDAAVIKGVVGAHGINETADKQAAAQVLFLRNQTELGKKESMRGNTIAKILKMRKDGDDLEADEVKLLENRDKTLKIIAGLHLKVAQNIQKQLIAQEKTTALAQNQLDVLELQNKAKEKQADLKSQQVAQKIATKEATIQLKISELDLKIQKDKLELIEKQFEAQQKHTDEIRKGLDIQKEILSDQKALISLQASGAQDAAIRAAQGQLADLQAFEHLSPDEDQRVLREQIINLEFTKQMEIIKEKERLIREEHQNALTVLQRQEDDLNARQTLLQKQMSDNIDIVSAEAKIQVAKVALETLKITNDNKNLEAQKGIITAQESAQLKQIEAQKITELARVKAREIQLRALDVQVKVANKLAEATGPRTALVKAIAALVDDFDLDSLKDLPAAVELDFKKLQGLAAEEAVSRSLAISTKEGGIRAGAVSKRGDIDTQLAGNKKLLELIKQRASLERKLAQNKAEAEQAELINDFNLQEAKKVNIEAEREKLQGLLDLKLEGIKQEKAAASDAAKAKLEAIARERDQIRGLANDISGVLKDKIGGSVKDLFKAIREGTLTVQNFKQGFQDMLLGIIEGIQEKMVDRFIVKPIEEFIEKSIMDIFNLSKEESPEVKATNLVTKKVGEVQTEVRSSAQMICDCILGTSDKPVPLLDAFSNPEGRGGGIGEDTWEDIAAQGSKTAEELRQLAGVTKKTSQETSFFQRMLNGTSTLFDTLKGALSRFGDGLWEAIQGLGGFIQKLFSFGGSSGGGSSGGGFLSSLFSSFGGGGGGGSLDSSMFFPGASASDFAFLARGGLVRHMAGGGVQRDSVPALLEPGEFVIRKPMARSIGTPALNAMNSTGMTPNVEVVIKNEGTPQEATQAGTPRIDVDKMVVEIVTRDIRNNGPIRKTLRGEGTS